MLTFFAHAGHAEHDPSVAPEPSWFSSEPAISLSLLLGLVLIILLTKYFTKLSPGANLVVIMGYLFVVGVGSYSIAPIASIVALTGGICLTLFATLAQLGKK